MIGHTGGLQTNDLGLQTIVFKFRSLCPCANTFCVRGVAWGRPRRASKHSIAGFGTQDLFQQQDQNKQAQGAVLGSFLVPEIDMIFGDGVGASLVRGPYCHSVLV